VITVEVTATMNKFKTTGQIPYLCDFWRVLTLFAFGFLMCKNQHDELDRWLLKYPSPIYESIDLTNRH
jgi:hypothetical protein